MCQVYIKREEQTLEEARNLGRVKSSAFMESTKNIPIAQLSNTAKNSHSVVFSFFWKDPKTWKSKLVF